METSLRELLEGTKQYQVPLYQRRYSWRKDNLTRLWDDVLKLTEDRNAHGPDLTHFMGSLVLAPTPHIGPAGVARYLVVDGQQRLTTLTLLLAAIRDHRAETEGDDHRRRLNDLYLTNPWRPQEDRLKLVPTQADRVAYQGCIESAHQAGGADPVGEAYRYFRGMLAEHDDIEDEQDIEKLEESVLSGLTLVAVTTSHEDNVHRIFESLNNTGLKLTQGDLLRNYLFMRLPTRGPVVYGTQWLPLQGRLSDDQLELLFWLDMVQVDDSVGQRDTYQAQVSRLDRLPDEAAIEKEVRSFQPAQRPGGANSPARDGAECRRQGAAHSTQRVGHHDGLPTSAASARQESERSRNGRRDRPCNVDRGELPRPAGAHREGHDEREPHPPQGGSRDQGHVPG